MRRALVVLLLCAACAGEVSEPDSGLDDAGAPDAGPVDSGVAAGVTDAGVLDAGVHDAGVPDAGPFDAGVFDAGVPDAGPVDAGVAGRPVFVAVGYAGVRRSSTDLGLTWSAPQILGADGDNEFLLRAVTFGNGLFVSVGWKVLTSPTA